MNSPDDRRERTNVPASLIARFCRNLGLRLCANLGLVSQEVIVGGLPVVPRGTLLVLIFITIRSRRPGYNVMIIIPKEAADFCRGLGGWGGAVNAPFWETQTYSDIKGSLQPCGFKV